MNPQKPEIHPDPDPTGHVVIGLSLRGEERDARGEWVGADVELSVLNAGRYLLRVVTKDQFSVDEINTVFGELDSPEAMLDPDTTDHKKPYVLNDPKLSLDRLEEELANRKVYAGLAGSMFYIGPISRRD